MTSDTGVSTANESLVIRVCCGSGCAALGSLEVLEALRAAATSRGRQAVVSASPCRVGCRGFCSEGPLVYLAGSDVLYCRVEPNDAGEIIESAATGRIVDRLLYRDPVGDERCRGLADNPFFARQDRVVLRRCGAIDPEDIDQAVAHGAYQALRRAVHELGSAGVIDVVKRSGLQGRDGAGFPVGLKWGLVAESVADRKVVVGHGGCGFGLNVDRTLLEGDPHLILEGMAIAAFAVGAGVGRVVIKSEHQVAVARVGTAVEQARRHGLLGRGILGTEFDFDVEIMEDAGADLGGEETAILNLIEGRRGTARTRPPFPVVAGLWGFPTLINTFETLANIAPIIAAQGNPDAAQAGTTKVVAVSGRVARSGLAEVPLGTTVREIVRDIGGVAEAETIAAVHLGGPGGVTLSADELDTRLEYSEVQRRGTRLGSAGIVVLGDGDCPVALLRLLVESCKRASCGTCPPGRIGVTVLGNLLDRVESGAGLAGDIDRIERLGEHIRRSALCDVGRKAASSVLAGMDSFRGVFERHLSGSGCPRSGE